MRVTITHFLWCAARTPILTRWSSSFLKVFKWIWSTVYGLECTGLAFGSMSVCTFLCVDKFQEFHWTSYCFPGALGANLLFDVHLDEWVLSRPQLHLSFHTWHPESLLQSTQANLHWRSCLQLGCETCLPWHKICLNPNLQVDKVGWSNQTILYFLLSSSALFQSWKESLYPGWCRIWRCCCQTLVPFVGWCACSYQTLAVWCLALWQLLVS